jgi:hypothetical protein
MVALHLLYVCRKVQVQILELVLIFTVLCFPCLVDSEYWTSAVPQTGVAHGGWTLTIAGSFVLSKQYKCKFEKLETESSFQSTVESTAASPSTIALLQIYIPQINFAAGYATISVMDSSNNFVTGPGGTSEQILFQASWQLSVSQALQAGDPCATGPASGGSRITIIGLGFDVSSSDYVCKFWCFNDACTSDISVQSTVPVLPTDSGSLSLICLSPLWPYNARKLAGRTKITLEKGGLFLPYQSQQCDGVFDFMDGWSGTDITEGYATKGSTTITVNGFGFETGSQNYSCLFYKSDDQKQAGAADVVDSTKLACYVPTWPYPATGTGIQIYKQNCAGSRNASASCDTSNRIPLLAGNANPVFIFKAAIASINPRTSEFDVLDATVLGGGLDPDGKAYLIQFSDGFFFFNISIPKVNATGNSLQFLLPSWGSSPNTMVSLTVFESGFALPISPSGNLNFTFTSSWTSFQTSNGLAEGSAAGKEEITIRGQGFVINASVGTSSDYACVFRDEMGNMLKSNTVLPITPSRLICYTPVWGLINVATKTIISLFKGAYEYPAPDPAPVYRFIATWYDWSSTKGPLGGGVALTLHGYGFNTSAQYRCRFSFNQGELLAFSAGVLPVSPKLIVCLTPTWRHAESSKTRLELLEELSPVRQFRSAENNFADAVYEFSAGFKYSVNTLIVAHNQAAQFSFYPDTEPLGNVTVMLGSANESIATVSTPFQLIAARGVMDNLQFAIVQCVGVGSTSVSLFANGSNFESIFENVVFVTCCAGFILSTKEVSMQRGATKDIQLTTNISPSDVIQVSLISKVPSLIKVMPSNLTFFPSVINHNNTYNISVTCDGTCRSDILVTVVYHGNEKLFQKVSSSISIICLPGFNIAPSIFSLQASSVGLFKVSLDSLPSLKTLVFVQNESPDVVDIGNGDELLVFPFNSTIEHDVKVIYRRPGNASLRLRAVSSSLTHQILKACPDSDKAASCCMRLFEESGCNFTGYTNNISVWTTAMQQLSNKCQVSDCSIYAGCFRVRCCSSANAKTCISSAVTKGCDKTLLVPPLSSKLDSASDWGYKSLSETAQQQQLSMPLVPGLDCGPFIPCAWQECFPQNGNYDEIYSETISIIALPGFTVEPQQINLQQGIAVTIQITPNKSPANPITVSVDVSASSLSGKQGEPIAIASPATVQFLGLYTQNVSLVWNVPGRGDLRLIASGSSEFESSVQILANAVSSSPGYTYCLEASPCSANSLQRIPVSDSRQSMVYLTPDVVPSVGLQVSVVAGPNILAVSSSSLFFRGRSIHDPTISSESLFVSSKTDTFISLQAAPATTAIHVLSSGSGNMAGFLRIDGYGGNGFLATYAVDIVDWGIYCDMNHSILSGENYSWMGRSNFTGPTNNTGISIDSCMVATEPIYLLNQNGSRCLSRHMGLPVPACEPRIEFDVVGGKVVSLRMSSKQCFTTGITCQISLNKYSGRGFLGFFTTGISKITLLSQGVGYKCDWACFITVVPNAISNQTCISGNVNCSFAPAIIAYGDIGKMRSVLQVQKVAGVTITPEVLILQARQTISVTVTPLEVPTGNTTFKVVSNSSQVLTTNFAFTENRPIFENVKTFNVSDLGSGPSSALLTIIGTGRGNFDGFQRILLVIIKPGFYLSHKLVYLQQYPGIFVVTVMPDTPPTKDTTVNLIIESQQAGSDDFALDSSKSILTVNNSFIIPKGGKNLQQLVIVHNGADWLRMKNRISGSANLYFTVSDSASNYDGVDRSDAAKIAVFVLPGFKSNIPVDHKVLIQKGTSFVMYLMLDHPATTDILVNISISNSSLATVTKNLDFQAGDQGPVVVSISHIGIAGFCDLHISSMAKEGNYAYVIAEKYIYLNMRPGFVISSNSISLQHQAKYASFSIALDTRPTMDTVVIIKSSNPDVAIASSNIIFLASEWKFSGSPMKPVLIMWVSPGAAILSFIANNPESNYDQVISGNVSVTTFNQISVSESNVLVQKGGSVDISVSTPLKPKENTIFTYVSSPLGVVSLSPQHVLAHDTNDSFILKIAHVQRGSATVRIVASAPGDIYDGTSYDISATAMPGFNFSSSKIQLFSCAYRPVCQTTLSFWLDTIPTADVGVQISSSDPSVAKITPNEALFPASTGISKVVNVTISYVSSGLACLSFAASSTGNYDKVSCGGVTVIALPDLVVSHPVMNMPLGAYPHGISDFDLNSPVIYVVDGSFSTFILSPSVPPNAEIIVKIINDSPTVVETNSSLTFLSEGLDGGLMKSFQEQVIFVRYLKAGVAVLTFEVVGGNYDGARGPIVKVNAVPRLNVSVDRAFVPYSAAYNLTVSLTDKMTGRFVVNLEFDNNGIVQGGIGGGPGTANVTPRQFEWPLGQQEFTVSIQHVSAGWSRLRIVAFGNSSNYHHSEAIVVVTLLFPGWDLSENVLHVQRWKDNAMIAADPPFRGYALLYVSPQAYPDAITKVETLNQDPQNILVQSQQSIEYPNGQNFPNANIFPFTESDSFPMKYYFNISHVGRVAKSTLSFNTPISAKWPRNSGCAESDATCPAGFAIYYSGNYLQVIPPVTILTHAGFITPIYEIAIQRQGSQVFSLALDYPPDADSTISFISSNSSIADVLETVTFFLGETAPRNVTVVNINPGIAYISFMGHSIGVAYGGAIATNCIKILCLKGFEISSLIVRVQAPPMNQGLAVFTIRPDDVPSQSIQILISSSRPEFVQVETGQIFFQAGNSSAQEVKVRHMKAGTMSFPVKIVFSLITSQQSNYFGVTLPFVDVIALGRFVFSQTVITLQKGRTVYITIAPNVPPDQDVTVYVNISNSSVASCTRMISFFAQSTEPQTISIVHISKGKANLSFEAFSVQGNYNGSVLIDGVSVTALHGFSAFYLAQGISDDEPASQIGFFDQLFVQKQPTSPLSFAEFLVTTDDDVDQKISVEILSSNNTIATPVTTQISFHAEKKKFQKVKIRHGGSSGQAIIYFRVLDGALSNYAGIESGNVSITASPGLTLSKDRVDVQKNGYAVFTVSPDTPLTGDVIVNMVSSDPSIATVPTTVRFQQKFQLGPQNTISVAVTYQNVGTVSISFFASGSNFDGTVWFNGIIGTCRPGFILSVETLNIPYAGFATFTLKPDTEPTADMEVVVISSQPTKVMPIPQSLFLAAGSLQEIPIIIQSRCSTDPGNCARSGSSIINFLAFSRGGNYDGVSSSNFVLAVVFPPTLTVSPSTIYLQQSDGFAYISITPSVPPNLETVLSLAPLDSSICNVTSDIVLRDGKVNAAVFFVGIGQTFVSLTVSGPPDSIYSDIDPINIHVRTLGSFNLSTQKVILQDQKNMTISIRPNLEPSSDILVSVVVSDMSVLYVEPPTILISPPRILIGSNIPPRVGMQVVRSEAFQVWPRLGVGVIAQILNDNLDLVTVNWTAGIKLQLNPVGRGGKFALALYNEQVQSVIISRISNGKATISLHAISGDVNYNGVIFTNAIEVDSQPTVILKPTHLNIQLGSTSSFELSPSVAPESDLVISITALTQNKTDITGIQEAIAIAYTSPASILLYRVHGNRKENRRLINVSCVQPGKTLTQFIGRSGNFALMDCTLLPVTCLPGFSLSKKITKSLSGQNSTDEVQISLQSIPSFQVTVILTSSDPELATFTRRLVFEPFLSHQTQTIVIEHAGSFRSGTVFLSLLAFGGNYDGAELLRAIEVPIIGPSLVLSANSLLVQPGGTSTFYVRLDTAPSASVWINASTSDASVVTVQGPNFPFTDTSFQLFNVTYVGFGQAEIQILVISKPGSTYGDYVNQTNNNMVLNVQAQGPGFVFNQTMVTLPADGIDYLSFGPDSAADSTVHVMVYHNIHSHAKNTPSIY